MSRQPISIVGGGIGGLTLGRSLLKYGISAVLFERMASSPRHSYAITLHASAYKPLLAILDMDEWAFRRRVAVDSAVGGEGKIDPAALAYPAAVQSNSFRAHREKFEKLLREGLVVQWEHALERVERTPGGAVLHMLNGRKVDKTLVVGADGPHSNTRKTLLPDTPLSVLPFVAFNGKRRVKQDTFQKFYAPYMKNATVIEVKRNESILHVSITENTGDIVSINWIYSRPARGSTDPLHKPNRPVAGATDIPDEFFDEIATLTDLPQPFKEVFDREKLRKERVLHWLMRTVNIEESDLMGSLKDNVIFLGDSAHAQPILGGEGANDAIIDGIQLAKALAKGGTEDLAAWYQSRIHDWKDGVEKSERTIAEMHTEQKPNL